MRPQGYIGRGFPALHPELRLPGRITDWNDDHQLIALALRGEDCVGNLIIGEESLNRLLAQTSVVPQVVGHLSRMARARRILSRMASGRAFQR
jgi:hypothetical protein